MAAFRSIAVDAPEGTLSGTVRPSGFKPTGPRPGSAVASDYFVVFHDTDGAAMIGGSATIAWYGVSFDGPTLMTASIGAAVVTADHVTRKIEVGEGVYFWPRVTAMTPPAVAAKSIRVNVGASADGDYSIQVDATTAVEFTASGDDPESIRDALVAGFAAHPTASAEADDAVDDLIVTLDTAGVDFELTLVSPGDALTQEEVDPVLPIAATLRIYTAASVASGVDIDAIAAAVSAGLTVPTAAEIAVEVAAEVPDGAEILAQVQAGIVAESAQFGAFRTIMHLPDVSRTGELTGALAYTIRSVISDKYTALYGFTITSDIACTVTWWSAATYNMSDEHPIAAGGNWTIAPDKNRPFKTNLDEILKLVCSSAVAKLRVTFWAEYINSFNDSP